ncbi:hypothetical protein ABPG73_007141 [Tetrahymena malaccensis]
MANLGAYLQQNQQNFNAQNVIKQKETFGQQFLKPYGDKLLCVQLSKEILKRIIKYSSKKQNFDPNGILFNLFQKKQNSSSFNEATNKPYQREIIDEEQKNKLIQNQGYKNCVPILNNQIQTQTYANFYILNKDTDFYFLNISVGSQSLKLAIQDLAKQIQMVLMQDFNMLKNFTKSVRGQEYLTLFGPYPFPQKLIIKGLGRNIGGNVIAGTVSHYEIIVAYRDSGAIEAAKLGASAALVRNIIAFSIESPHTGCHTESWDLGSKTSAKDDGSDYIICCQDLRLTVKKWVIPKSTVNFINWCSEKQGGSLSAASQYARDHKAKVDKHAVAIENTPSNCYYFTYHHQDGHPMSFMDPEYMNESVVDPIVNQDYVVRDFLRIPKTNILIINTIYKDNYDSSIVYYNDLSSSSGEIINVVKPNFVIIDMQYNPQLEQIMVTNYDNLIFADPYTLKAISSFPFPKLQAISLIDQTNYIILTNFYNSLQIYDYMQQKLMLTMDNSKSLKTFPNNTYLFQYYSNFYTLANGQTIILTTNDMGIITWTIDLQNLKYTFNGYIKYSIVSNQGDNYKSYVKHPTQDIFFIGGVSLEIIIVKVIDITKNQFKKINQISFFNYKYTDAISNLRYTLVNTNNTQQPTLWVGTQDYIYYVQLSESSDGSQITFGKYDYHEVTTYGRWYSIQENSVFYISSQDYVTIFNYQTLWFSYNLYFYGDLYCRRFIRQQQGQVDQFILLSGNQIKLFDRGNFGYSSQYQKQNLAGLVRWTYGSFYKVKNTSDYYFIKSGDNNNSQIFLLPIYPINENGSVLNITSIYGLSWSDININLDPFYLNNSYLVAFAFPKKSSKLNYLFMVIDCTSQQKKQYLLKSDKPNDNIIQTAFAIPSLENQNNLELIGVDNFGTVYSWDLSKDGFPFKFSTNFSFCNNSLIGDIFYYNELKRLIISCDDNKVYSLDYKTGGFQTLVQLSQQPFALRAFSKANIVAIGDFNTGVAYIFKFNTTSKQFDVFLQLQSSKIQDQIIYIEMLNDNTIWVQFTFSNLFYSLNDCLQDSKLCTQCTQQYNFMASDEYDSQGVYGVGTQQQPFTTSNNFLTAMIKYYKQVVSGVSNMFVDILVAPNKILDLNSKLMNFDFNSIISLNFKSTVLGQYATLQYQNLLKFNNYNLVGFQDIIIYFGLDDENNDCGLSFSNIENNVSINNIQLFLYSPTSQPKSCQSIYSDSSTLNVLNYQISGEDFTNHQSVLLYFNVTNVSSIFLNIEILNTIIIFKIHKIFFNNFSLSGCTLGESFSILKQESELKVSASNITLSDNVCSTDSSGIGTENNKKISALFSAGYFSVQNMTANNNIFCKKIIFSVVSSLDQTNQVFSFQDIYINNNLFQARTTYLLFDALYSMNASPSHELDLSNIQFKNNSLVKYSEYDQIGAQYFQTNNIAKVSSQDIMLINHFDIQFGVFQYVNNFDLINFNCVNDDAYLAKIPNQQTYGCLELNEFISANITQIQIINKKAQDTSLLLMENSKIQSANLSITKGVFENLYLFQNGVNTEAIPIQVESNYQIGITIDTCLFQNITLKSIQFTLTYSTSALWIQNYVGNVLIKNSQFYNSYSNSQYGLIFVQANQLTLDTVQFNNATFYLNQPLSLFNSYGAMLNVKAQSLNILKSNFNQATAIKGAFIYMISFGQIFQVNISDTVFSEGYADQDGGAIYIDSGGQQLQFNCQNCQFSNIYTQQAQASTIGQEKYSKTKSNVLNKIQFQGGFIKNVFGVTANYFIDASNTNLQFNQIPAFISQQFNSNSLPQQLYLTKFKGLQQQATLANLLKSSLQILGCKFSNIFQLQSSLVPLFISSTLSNITIIETQFEDSLFSGSTIYALQSNVQFEHTSFKNVSQAQSSDRILQQSAYSSPDPQGASLIIFQQSTVSIKSKSSFIGNSCKSNCNGGAIQLLQSTITLDDTSFQNIDSSFGGALYIQGMNSSNIISNTNFINCKSQNDGGALYLKALQKDIYGEYWGTSFAKSAKFQCTRCDQIKGNIWIVVLMTVWTLISMSLAIKGDVETLKERVAIITIQKNLRRKTMTKIQSRRQTTINQINMQSFNTITHQKTTSRNSIYEVREKQQKLQVVRTDEEKSGVYIKMLTNYVQIVGSIATFNLSIPSGIFEFPQSVGQPLKQTMNSLDCALQEMNSSMPIIYMRLLFSILIPFIYMTLFLLFKQYGHLFDGSPTNEDEQVLQQLQQDEENPNQLRTDAQFCGTLKFIAQEEDYNSEKQINKQDTLLTLAIHKKEDSDDNLIKFGSQQSLKSEQSKPKSRFYIETLGEALKEDQVNIEMQNEVSSEVYQQSLVVQQDHDKIQNNEEQEEKEQQQQSDKENPEQQIQEAQFCETLKFTTREEEDNQLSGRQNNHQETLNNLAIDKKEESNNDLFKFDYQDSLQESSQEENINKYSVEVQVEILKDNQVNIEMKNQNNSV